MIEARYRTGVLILVGIFLMLPRGLADQTKMVQLFFDAGIQGKTEPCG